MFKKFRKIFYTSVCTYMSDEEMLKCMQTIKFNPYEDLFKNTEIKPIYMTITEYTDYLDDILKLNLEKPIKLEPVDIDKINEIVISRFCTDRDKLVTDFKTLWVEYLNKVIELHKWYTSTKNNTDSTIYRNRLYVRPYIVNNMEVIKTIQNVINEQRKR